MPALPSSLSDEPPVLPNTTPDLLLVTTVKPPAPSADKETPPIQVSEDQAQQAGVGTVRMVGITESIPISALQDAPGSPSGDEERGEPAPELRASFLPRTLSLRNSISKSGSGARWSMGRGQAGLGFPD